MKDNAAVDAAVQGAVLRILLLEHPSPLTAAELDRRLAGGQGSGECVDAIERAVAELTGFGLVNREGQLLLASQAAVRFDRLALD